MSASRSRPAFRRSPSSAGGAAGFRVGGIPARRFPRGPSARSPRRRARPARSLMGSSTPCNAIVGMPGQAVQGGMPGGQGGVPGTQMMMAQQVRWDLRQGLPCLPARPNHTRNAVKVSYGIGDWLLSGWPLRGYRACMLDINRRAMCTALPSRPRTGQPGDDGTWHGPGHAEHAHAAAAPAAGSAAAAAPARCVCFPGVRWSAACAAPGVRALAPCNECSSAPSLALTALTLGGVCGGSQGLLAAPAWHCSSPPATHRFRVACRGHDAYG